MSETRSPSFDESFTDAFVRSPPSADASPDVSPEVSPSTTPMIQWEDLALVKQHRTSNVDAVFNVLQRGEDFPVMVKNTRQANPARETHEAAAMLYAAQTCSVPTPLAMEPTEHGLPLANVFGPSAQSLFDWMREKDPYTRLTSRDWIHIIQGAQDALTCLHGRFLVHRQICPEVIIYNRMTQRVFLVDFDDACLMQSAKADARIRRCHDRTEDRTDRTDLDSHPQLIAWQHLAHLAVAPGVDLYEQGPLFDMFALVMVLLQGIVGLVETSNHRVFWKTPKDGPPPHDELQNVVSMIKKFTATIRWHNMSLRQAQTVANLKRSLRHAMTALRSLSSSVRWVMNTYVQHRQASDTMRQCLQKLVTLMKMYVIDVPNVPTTSPLHAPPDEYRYSLDAKLM